MEASATNITATFVAALRSVGTACTMAGAGIYMHRRNFVTPEGKRMFALLSQQVTIPLFLFTKIVFCNQDWSTEPCPNVTESLGDVWVLLFWPAYVVACGFAVGTVAAYISGTPKGHARRAVWVACAFGNSTGLPITLLTVVHANFPSSTKLGKIDPTLFLSAYLLLYPVLQWGIGGWLLAPSSATDGASGETHKMKDDDTSTVDGAASVCLYTETFDEEGDAKTTRSSIKQRVPHILNMEVVQRKLSVNGPNELTPNNGAGKSRSVSLGSSGFGGSLRTAVPGSLWRVPDNSRSRGVSVDGIGAGRIGGSRAAVMMQHVDSNVSDYSEIPRCFIGPAISSPNRRECQSQHPPQYDEDDDGGGYDDERVFMDDEEDNSIDDQHHNDLNRVWRCSSGELTDHHSNVAHEQNRNEEERVRGQGHSANDKDDHGGEEKKDSGSYHEATKEHRLSVLSHSSTGTSTRSSHRWIEVQQGSSRRIIEVQGSSRSIVDNSQSKRRSSRQLNYRSNSGRLGIDTSNSSRSRRYLNERQGSRSGRLSSTVSNHVDKERQGSVSCSSPEDAKKQHDKNGTDEAKEITPLIKRYAPMDHTDSYRSKGTTVVEEGEEVNVACWETAMNVLSKCLQPPVVGALLGIFVSSIQPLRGIFVDLIDRNDSAPLEWMFDGLYSIAQAAVPVNMIILGINLSASASKKKPHTSKKEILEEEETSLSNRTLGAIVLAKMVLMPIVGVLSTIVFFNFVWTTVPHDIDSAVYLVTMIVFITPTANNVMIMVELGGGGLSMKESIARAIGWQYAVAPFVLSMSVAAVVGVATSPILSKE